MNTCRLANCTSYYKGRIIRAYVWIIREYIDVLFSFPYDINRTLNMYVGNICIYFKKKRIIQSVLSVQNGKKAVGAPNFFLEGQFLLVCVSS